MKNNKVELIGVINSNIEYSHNYKDLTFYKTDIAVARQSGAIDFIPIVLPSTLVDSFESLKPSTKIKIIGTYRSHNASNGKLELYVYAENINLEDSTDYNEVELIGFVCKNPAYRETPFGRNICDILLAVNRDTNGSDYIPIIAWGKYAKELSTVKVGTQLKLNGRIQSRLYTKIINGIPVNKIAYEVSTRSYELINDID